MLPLCSSVLLPAVVMVMMAAFAFATIASKIASVAILALSLPLHGIGSLAKFVAIRISAGWHSMPQRRNGLISIAFATIASKTAFVAILALTVPLHGIGSLVKFVAMRASAGWHSMPLRHNGLIWLVLLIVMPKIMAAGCPHCFGANPACTLHASASGTCPFDAVPNQNRAIIAGTSSSSLCLTNCILPRFLRCFGRGELSTVTSLAKRPAPGTTIAIDTSAGKLTQTLSNLRAGLTSKEDIENAFSEAISSTTDAAKNAALRADMKLLINIKTIGDENTTHEQNGIYTWLLAKVVAFITAGTFITTSVIVAASTSSVASVHRAKVPRPTTFAEFAQAINLYIMYFVALGVGNVMVITQFWQFIVYDTINVHHEDWRTAYELAVLAFRKIEDCHDGAWNMITVTGEVVLAGMMAEARLAAKHFHPVFFRTRGGEPQPLGDTTGDDSALEQ